jgi:hypothetical protein
MGNWLFGEAPGGHGMACMLGVQIISVRDAGCPEIAEIAALPSSRMNGGSNSSRSPILITTYLACRVNFTDSSGKPWVLPLARNAISRLLTVSG